MSADVRYVLGYRGWEVEDRATGRHLGHVMRFGPEWYAWAFRPPLTVEWRTFVGCWPTRLAAGLAILNAGGAS